MSSDTETCYCGILDMEGLRCLAVRTDEAASDFYKESKSSTDSCLIQLDLNSSQVDIIAELNKSGDSDGAAVAMVTFSEGDMGVADDQMKIYSKLESKFNRKKK